MTTKNFNFDPEYYNLQVDWDKRMEKEKYFFDGIFSNRKIKRVLEIGCGTGHHAQLFARYAAEVVAIDPDPEMIDFAGKNTIKAKNITLYKKGFEEILKDYPEVKVVRSQSGDFTRAKGKEVMEAFLKAEGGKIAAVYAHNDDMALGAIQAIEEAGLKPGEDIVIVSIDAVKGAFEAMVAGKLNCTVECNPLLGPAAFDAVEKALAGEPLEKKTIVQDRVFDQSVAASVIGSRKY